MTNWEKVLQDRELLRKVEDFVRGLVIDSPQEVFDEMNSITGNAWTRKEYELHCFDYPDFYDMEEVVYALFHEGKYPMRTREDIFAWNIEQAVEDDKAVCTFFILGAYKKYKEKSNLYTSVDVKGLYQELLGAFPGWNEDADSYENLFYLKNKEVYGFTKTIIISNVYDRKFLSCTLTNMNQEEKDTFIKVVRKYCNHVVREEIHPNNTVTYKMKFMFDWRSGVCLWADNEAAKAKFNGYPVEICDLPISDGLKATLEDLICLYDEAFDFEKSNGDLLWDKNQIEEFLCTAKEAYACLCEELGPEYEVELEFDEYDDILSIEPEEEKNKMSIMDRINKSDYVEVFSAVLGKVMVAQERGNEYVVKDRDWTYDFVEGTISFGEDVYPVQFIGTEEEVWEWAPEEDYEEFNKSVFSLVNESYALGEEWKLKALTLPELKLEDGYNGDYLSVICCGISKERYIYYRVEQNEILLFMGIGNAPEEVYAPVDRNEFKKIVTKCIKDFPIDHKIFLEAFLEWNNTPYEWNGDNVIAHFDKDLVFVFEEDEGDYCITSIKAVSGKKTSKKKANSKISITVEDGEIKISGSLNLGYIGTYTDSQIELNDTLEEIREWDIIQDNLDEDCSEEELIAFLNRYFNEFADKITRNIDNINGTFLLQTFTDMECNEIDFMVIDELFLEDKLPYGNEEDIAELYNFARDGLRSLIPYLESPNDGCIPKGHIETVLRSFFPAFDFDCFIRNIVPEVLTLCDGSIAFQCSDAFDEAILCGAYAELDEELCFTDWHNF